jgi:hypothetical protein
MLGDWARLNVLIGEPGLSAPSVRARANLPRWHRGIRLYGQRLLERADDGPERWRQAVEGLQDCSEEGTIIRLDGLKAATLLPRPSKREQCSWRRPSFSQSCTVEA